MRLLFDQNVPAPLARSILGHEVARAAQVGWGELANGELPAAAEYAGFDVLVTADQNLRHQQNLANRGIGLVVLSSNHWPLIRDCLPHVVAEILRGGNRAGGTGAIPWYRVAAPRIDAQTVTGRVALTSS